MKITRFELLWGSFIYRDQASKWVHKIMQNDAKMHHKSPQNDNEKYWFLSCNAQKRTPSTDLQNYIKTHSLLSFPVLLCSRHGCKNRSKSSKIYHKITTKNTKPGVAMVKNARRRPTCEHASKRVDFCPSRFCFAHVMVQKSLKIVENHRWGSVMRLRSGPPGGGPIRSVFRVKKYLWRSM